MERAGGSASHAQLLEWLEKEETEIHPAFELRDFAGSGFGAIATEELEEGTTLFSLPRECAFTVRNAPLLGLLTEDELQGLGDGWAPLILAMMFEYLKGAESKWHAYFQTMPKIFDSLMFWSDAELDELQASAVRSKIGKAEAEADYRERILPLIKARADLFTDPAAYTLDFFHQIGSSILSRSFTVMPPGVPDPLDSDDEANDPGDVAMIPLADVLNAKSAHDNARLFYDSETHLEMRTTRDVEEGEQLYNSYSDPPNSDLLRRYGHVDEPNPYDVAEIRGDFIAKLAAAKTGDTQMGLYAKTEWALEHDIDDAFNVSMDELLPDELIASAYLYCLSHTEFSKVDRKKKMFVPSLNSDEPLKNFLIEIFEAREKEYGTTLEEDDELLKDDSLPIRKRMAVIVRRGEKAILRAAQARVRNGPEDEDEPPPAKKAKKA